MLQSNQVPIKAQAVHFVGIFREYREDCPDVSVKWSKFARIISDDKLGSRCQDGEEKKGASGWVSQCVQKKCDK